MDVLQLLPSLESAIGILAGMGGGAVVGTRYVVKPAVRFVRRVSASMTKLDIISDALGPNGGHSLADQIRQTRDMSSVMAAQIADIRDHMDTPFWEANANGDSTRFNRAFELAFGYRHTDLLGSGWIQLVTQSDRDRVLREWAVARMEGRAYWTRTYFVPSNGTPVQVELRIEPTIVAGRLLAWRGSCQVVKVGE